jgi:diguanylate cyclase (GGDEF)-like protein
MLEAQYYARNDQARRGLLMAAMAVAAAAVLGGLVTDLIAGPAVFQLGLIWRLPVVLACLLSGLVLYRVRRTWQEALLMALPMLSGLVVTQVMAEVAVLHDPANAAYVDRAAVAASIGVAAILTLAPWRFAVTLTATVFAMIAYPAVAFYYDPIKPHLVELTFGETVLLLALILARRAETARRTIFLHTLRCELAGMALSQANAEVVRLSTTDTLTGLANRRHFDAEIARLWRDRGRTDMGMALIEVDDFADYMANAGPAEADGLLRDMARVVAGCLRQDWDRAARWGDTSFGALLPGVDQDGLREIGERLRHAVAQMAVPYPGEPGRFVTASVGLAWCGPSSGYIQAEQMRRDADAALYAAKTLGPNRVVLAGDAQRVQGTIYDVKPYQSTGW